MTKNKTTKEVDQMIKLHPHLTESDRALMQESIERQAQLKAMGYTGKIQKDGSFDLPCEITISSHLKTQP